MIENIIRQGDSVILVGNEKSGKSLFIFQLICALTSAHPFIDMFNVAKPCKVTYFQLEGEISDSQDRMKRMIKTMDISLDLFQYYFYAPMQLENLNYMQSILKTIKEHQIPDVLIIDPLYFAFAGSLNHDEVIRQFIGNIRVLKDALKCTVILVHHTHKQKWSTDGYQIDEGDDALFGSKFLKAWADHILMFHYDKKKEVRTLSCATQRSGDIVKQCNLRLVEPDPLYFEVMDKEPTKELLVNNLLACESYTEGLTAEIIMKRLDLTKNLFYSSIKPLLAQGLVKKVGTRPILYVYNREKLNANLTDGGERIHRTESQGTPVQKSHDTRSDPQTTEPLG